MSSNVKQHFIPKVYLRYFTKYEDGKDLYVINHSNGYNKTIQKKNSGDAIFWEKNFYSSSEFEDPLTLEHFFGRDIEPNYPNLVTLIKQEHADIAYEVKLELLHWIFYAKLRSPANRISFIDMLVGYGGPSNQGIDALAKIAHLSMFHNPELFERLRDDILIHLASKKWTVLKTTNDNPFWTSDSPGYGIDLDDFERDSDTVPSSFWHNRRSDTLFFFPLTKEYMLQIAPHNAGTPLDINISNSPVPTEVIDAAMLKHLNYWTLITSTMVISSEPDPLKPVEDLHKAIGKSKRSSAR